MKQRFSGIVKLFILFTLSVVMNIPHAFALPDEFVYLKDIDPTIIEDLRYYSNENFIGRKIDGYKANRVILTSEAADALSRVQQQLLKDGYSLVVYDAYRPARSVDYFKQWSLDLSDQSEKEKYYPAINKVDVFKLGYVAEKSSHSRGSTVDITIIKLGTVLKNISAGSRQLRDGSSVPFLDDGTIDMGTSFDLFGEASHHDNNLIDSKHLKMRNYLRNIMKTNGFDDYKEEWWHYTLKQEPFPDTYFDFEVE